VVCTLVSCISLSHASYDWTTDYYIRDLMHSLRLISETFIDIGTSYLDS
jgi:hypothetical protein